MEKSMPLPSFCTEETALKLLKKARANRHDAVPRQILADWLEQYGGNDGRILSQVLRSSFGTNTIQRLAPADTQRLSPFVGAIHGWFHGCQDSNRDPVVRAWLLAPDSFELARGVWLEMMPVPAGTFLRGYSRAEVENEPDRLKRRQENGISLDPDLELIAKPFLMAKYPTTQEQWLAVNKTDPSKFIGATRPVESIRWRGTRQFSRRISRKFKQTFSVPMPVEWEYACRAGTTTPFHFGDTCNGTQANCNGKKPYGSTSPGPYVVGTTPVGSYPPNDWGIYDMHGNVMEWCADDPAMEIDSTYYVRKGGCWRMPAIQCRAASSNTRAFYGSGYNCGFRVLMRITNPDPA